MELPKQRTIIADGGTGTFMQSLGYDYDGEICIEEFILSHKEELKQLQRDFVSAGSDIILTATFAANPVVLEKYGKAEKCAELNARIAELTVEAVGGKAVIAGDIGPTRLPVKPFGESEFADVLSAYRTQVGALNKYVDIFYIETCVSLSDMRAATLACKETGKPVFITVPVDENGNTFEEEVPVKSALITLEAMGADAFGLNCSPVENIVGAMRELIPFAKIPLIAKPCYDIYTQNGGEWIKSTVPPEDMPKGNTELLEMGVSVIGGCCGTTPAHIARLKQLAQSVTAKQSEKTDEDEDISLVLTNHNQVFYLEPDTTESSEPIMCCQDMSEQITEICEESYDVLTIQIDSVDDAEDFAVNAPLVTLPVMFLSDTEEALERALFLYQGRAMIDSRSMIETEKLKLLSKRYGAVIY